MKRNIIINNTLKNHWVWVTVFALFLLQHGYGQSFPVVTPSNHTVYFQIENDAAKTTFCSYSMPNYGTSLAGTLIIPDSVEYTNVKYPVTAIGYNAFHHAYGMDTVILPNTITAIHQEAFAGCLDLRSVAIPNSVLTIGNVAFGGCHNLSDLTIGESVTTIGNQAFDCDTSLVSLIIPNSVVSIGSAAFSQNYNLRTVRFGSSVTSVGASCFSNCPRLDSLIFVTEDSPSFGGGFYGSPDTLNIIIPCGSYHSYSYQLGTQHNYTVPTVELIMTVSSSQPLWGSAIIVKDADSNDVRCDSSCVVKAVPNYGYHFQQWNYGSTNIQDTLFLVGDSSVIATFAKNNYTLLLQSADPLLGSVSGGGVYNYLDTVIVTATAIAPHYFLEHWSDGSTDSSRSIVITENMFLIAYFAIDTHTVSLRPDSIAHGSVSGEGRYPYGTVATVTAAPYSGYRFSHWSDGSTFNPYVFAVLQDTILTAIFIADGEPYQDTIIVYDTVYLTEYIHDTILVHDTTFVNITDTLWLHDTVYLHDTIYIYDTIFVGVDEVEFINAKIYTSHGQIVVEGTQGLTVWLYNVNGSIIAIRRGKDVHEGTPLHFDVPASGTYLVKIGNHPARRVVVIK